MKIGKHSICTKCIYCSHGDCVIEYAQCVDKKKVTNEIPMTRYNEQQKEPICSQFIDKNTIKRSYSTSLELARDAKIHGDKRLADAVIQRLKLCKELLYCADMAVIEREIGSLKSAFGIV